MGQWGNKQRNLKVLWDKWQEKNNHTKFMGCSRSTSKREVYNNTVLPQKLRIFSNNLIYYLKGLEKEEKTT